MVLRKNGISVGAGVSSTVASSPLWPVADSFPESLVGKGALVDDCGVVELLLGI